MTRKDILDKLDQLLAVHFPDEKDPGQSPWWGQEGSYKERFFRLCQQSRGVISPDDVAHHVRNIKRKFPLLKDDERRRDELILAWCEWDFAIRTI